MINLDELKKSLLEHGATKKDLQNTKSDRFDLILDKMNNDDLGLDNVLRILTIQQLLGIDKTRKSINKNKISSVPDNHYFKDVHSSSDHFFNQRKEDDTTAEVVTHEVNNIKKGLKLIVEYEILNDERLAKFNTFVSENNISPVRMVHEWYSFGLPGEDDNKINEFRFCPLRKLLLRQTHDKDFPIDIFNERSDIYFTRPFYEELNFANFLIEKCKTSLHALRKLSGMTQHKLELLSAGKFHWPLNLLLENGIKIEDFARVDEGWLQHLYNNRDFLYHSLMLCDAHEILIEPPMYKKMLKSLPSLNSIKTLFHFSGKSENVEQVFVESQKSEFRKS